MSSGVIVSNAAASSNADIPVRADVDVDGNLRQVYRLDIGTGTGEKLLSETNPIPTEVKNYAVRFDEDSTTISYLGEALPGTSTATASWRIKKIDTTSGVVVTWADGDLNFDNVWNDRTSLIYS